MATLIAHVLIGERVCSAMPRLRSSSAVYGAFLLGCVLVDANNTSDVERHQTHLTRLPSGAGGSGPGESCTEFLKRLDSLLLRRWQRLTEPEQAFVAGYLCHLAADEAWLEVSWRLLRELGLEAWDDLPVPTEVMLVTFNALSLDQFEDFPTIASVLHSAGIPDLFTHVPHASLRRMWDLAQPYVLEGGGPGSYLAFLEGQGVNDTNIERVRRHIHRYGEEARALINEAGGIERFVWAAVDRAVRVVPQLWVEGPVG